ncbi:hypothetical protein KR044_009607, partial [Drosophila immigrans]
CLHECLYNTAQVLNGSELNVENASKMLHQIMNSSKEIIDVYARSMKNCSEHADRLMGRMKKKTFGKEKCSMLPVFISVCAVDNMLVHCPAYSWRSSRLCEEGRDFMLKCKCDEQQSVC